MSCPVLSILLYYCFTHLLEALDCLTEENRREKLCKLICNSFSSSNMPLMPLLGMNYDDYSSPFLFTLKARCLISRDLETLHCYFNYNLNSHLSVIFCRCLLFSQVENVSFNPILRNILRQFLFTSIDFSLLSTSE